MAPKRTRDIPGVGEPTATLDGATWRVDLLPDGLVRCTLEQPDGGQVVHVARRDELRRRVAADSRNDAELDAAVEGITPKV